MQPFRNENRIDSLQVFSLIVREDRMPVSFQEILLMLRFPFIWLSLVAISSGMTFILAFGYFSFWIDV